MTSTDAELVCPDSEAVRVAVPGPGPAVTAKVAVVCPAGITTDTGMVTTPLGDDVSITVRSDP
jgi:hypothetical protein